MYIPLAEKLRPRALDELVGQEHITGDNTIISNSIKQQKPLSILLWGPPGSGKTTLAQIYAKAFSGKMYSLSAVASGVADIRKIIGEIEAQPLLYPNFFLFIDEIHRYNKAQQDLILPYLEKGTFILIGATTENPSFSLNNPLLSRLRVLTLNSLSDQDLDKILQRYEKLFAPLPLTPEARQLMISISQGDGRYLLNMVENLQGLEAQEPLEVKDLTGILQRRAALFDRGGEGHYNLISALHKSVRGSDPDASLYWFTRMIESGEDPLFIARRLIRMASEDIGLSDPQALPLAIAAKDAYEMLGSPEGELALAEAVVYLALSPKSNALYTAYNESKALAGETSHLNPPMIILNAPTGLMKKLGYGKGYIYDHDTPQAFSGQNYFPEGIERQEFYRPVERGFEREMKKRLDYFSQLRKKIHRDS